MEDRQREGGEPEEQARREREVGISALALRYRSGDRAALGDLYAELEPLVSAFLRSHLSAPRSLPLGVDAQDLRQQSYVALAEAALEWQPDLRDNFLPYFLRSFPWRIDRYLRSQTPSRRSRRIQLRSVPHDILMEYVAGVAGPDGRNWDEVLAWAELLRELPGQYGRVVRLHLYHGLPFAEVGKAVGIGRSAAHEAFSRALVLLKGLLVGPVSEPNRGRNERREGDSVEHDALRRCVEAMHRLASNGAPLPGRQTLCREADLTWREYQEIMARLRARGCVVGRRRGSAGNLACASAVETLNRLRG